jgi:hypothetical protein
MAEQVVDQLRRQILHLPAGPVPRVAGLLVAVECGHGAPQARLPGAPVQEGQDGADDPLAAFGFDTLAPLLDPAGPFGFADITKAPVRAKMTDNGLNVGDRGLAYRPLARLRQVLFRRD